MVSAFTEDFMRGAWKCALGLAVVTWGRDASAQETGNARRAALPTAALLSTAGQTPDDTALDSTIEAALERLHVVQVRVRPHLDLSVVQLAVGCDGETPECLGTIAAQSDVQVLIAPLLRRKPQEIVLELIAFDRRNAGLLRRVARHQKGQKLTREILDAVPDQLRELFDRDAPGMQAQSPAQARPQPAPVEARSSGSASAGPRASADAGAAHTPPVAPLLLVGGGALLLGAGVVTGAIMKDTQADYARSHVVTETDANANAGRLSRGRTQARVANALLGVGGAALAAGGTWLAIALAHDHERPSRLAIVPTLGRNQLGLVLVRRSEFF
jgi:hypothetical protein